MGSLPRLKQSSLDGLATESTRHIERKLDEVLTQLDIRVEAKSGLSDKYNKLHSSGKLDKQTKEAFTNWRKVRNAYTHAETDNYDRTQFKKEYEIAMKGLDELLPKQDNPIVGVIMLILIIVAVYYYWDDILDFFSNMF